MRPEDVAEEHRKYLDIKDNPQRVSTSAIFKLVSDGQVKTSERLTTLEVKQDQNYEQIVNLDKRVEKVTCELNDGAIINAGINSKFEERFNWQDKMQKVILSLIIFTIGLLLTVFGIPVVFP